MALKPSPGAATGLPEVVQKLLDKKIKGKLGKRGKVAEKLVQKHFDYLNNSLVAFVYDRLPDSRAARGLIQAQLCDYFATAAGTTFAVEVKETDHAYRLAKDKLPQLPKLRKSALAGRVPLIVIYHAQLKKWRCLPIAFFAGPIPPSWDMTPMPLFDRLEDALVSHPRWQAALALAALGGSDE